jgi:glucosamine 6-phosphate synthetase-like amidotransferase/phosphosugar isomerase protein
MLIAISYNGENIATSACAQRAKNNGAKTLAITTNSSSFLSHICDYKITSKNSFGDGDSSLKSFVFSYFTMCMLSLYLGRKSDVISEIYLNVSIKMAEMLSGKISSSIKNSPLSEMCSNIILDSDSVFVTGLGQDAFFAKEACQKLKSLADIPSIYCPLDSLEEEVSRANNCTVVAIISDKNVLQKVIYCLRRARALGAQVIIVTVSNVEEEIQDFANILSTDSSVPIFNPLTCISSIYKLATTIKEIKSTPASIA